MRSDKHAANCGCFGCAVDQVVSANKPSLDAVAPAGRMGKVSFETIRSRPVPAGVKAPKEPQDKAKPKAKAKKRRDPNLPEGVKPIEVRPDTEAARKFLVEAVLFALTIVETGGPHGKCEERFVAAWQLYDKCKDKQEPEHGSYLDQANPSEIHVQ